MLLKIIVVFAMACCKTFKIRHNGDRPYIVQISESVGNDRHDIVVYENHYDWDTEQFTKAKEPLLQFANAKYFLGKSVLCHIASSAKTVHKKYDGNSILVCSDEGKNEYTLIGGTIFSFETSNPIVAFWSPVGNAESTYPYAVDSQNRFYLLTENVVLAAPPVSSVNPNEFCPYTWYYGLTATMNRILCDYGQADGPYFVGPLLPLADLPSTTVFWQHSNNQAVTMEQVVETQRQYLMETGILGKLQNLIVIHDT